MNEPVVTNLLDLVEKPNDAIAPEIIRMGANEKAVIPFTSKATSLSVHYCEQPEISSYVQCVGEGCLLCRAGNVADERRLLPVVVPAENRIGVLMISTSMRPGSLLYQMLPHLNSANKKVLFVSRHGGNFQVEGRELRDGEDSHPDLVAPFLKKLEAGEIDLRCAVQKLSNEQIQAVSAIHQMLVLKGVIIP
jgi:hypothetical protein